MRKKSERTKKDKARFALLDENERRNLAKELGITETEVIKLSMSVRSGGHVEHNKQKIRDYYQALKDQQQHSLTGEEIDPAPNGEVL